MDAAGRIGIKAISGEDNKMPINIPGFVPASMAKPYLKLALEGWHRTGRSHLALSSPGPVGCIVFDGNTEHVAQKLMAGGSEIYLNKDYMPKSSLNVLQSQETYRQAWNSFQKTYFGVLLPSAVRTMVIDTSSDAWELCRLAELGTLGGGTTEKSVNQSNYGKINNVWRQMVNSCEKNLILTHKLQVYGTGQPSRKGMEESAYLCHAVIRTARLPKGIRVTEDPDEYTPTERGIPAGYWDAQACDGDFAIKIMDCSQDPRLAGKILVGSEVSFLNIARLVYPEVKKRYWLSEGGQV